MNLKSLAWWARPQPSYPASSFPVTHLTTLSSKLPMLHIQLNTFKTRLAISYATPISVPPFVSCLSFSLSSRLGGGALWFLPLSKTHYPGPQLPMPSPVLCFSELSSFPPPPVTFNPGSPSSGVFASGLTSINTSVLRCSF